ncbi:centrosomal protein of 89 kDa isoform X2 [Halyomorpha halys]
MSEKNVELGGQLEFQKDLTRSLLEKKSRLEREVAALRSRRVVGVHENDAVRERNRQLSQDIFLMKNILVKLNLELERYQDKLRNYENYQLKTDNSENASKQSVKKTEWVNGEMTVMAPLLIAYEESLREKEELISDFKVNIERLSGKIKEIVKENSELREKIAESEVQGEVNYSDWMNLKRELIISVEQNHLLSRQAKLAQTKIADLKTAFQGKLNEVCCERDEAVSKLNAVRADYLVLKGRNSVLEDEHERLKEDSSERIPKSVHSAYIAECKRLLDELKSRHTDERNALLNKISDLEEMGPSHLNNAVPAIMIRLKEAEVKLAESEEKRLRFQRKHEAMKKRMDGLIEFSKELILEHESLLKGVHGELRLNENLSCRIDKIKQQLKGVEMETLEQIKVLDENICSQVERVNRVQTEKNMEFLKLKEELLSKDSQIKELKNAAKNREKEMKLVWEAAIHDKKN